jgi:hypothetical protein
MLDLIVRKALEVIRETFEKEFAFDLAGKVGAGQRHVGLGCGQVYILHIPYRFTDVVRSNISVTNPARGSSDANNYFRSYPASFFRKK